MFLDLCRGDIHLTTNKAIRDLVEYRLSEDNCILDAKQRALLAARYTDGKLGQAIAEYSHTSKRIIVALNNILGKAKKIYKEDRMQKNTNPV